MKSTAQPENISWNSMTPSNIGAAANVERDRRGTGQNARLSRETRDPHAKITMGKTLFWTGFGLEKNEIEPSSRASSTRKKPRRPCVSRADCKSGTTLARGLAHTMLEPAKTRGGLRFSSKAPKKNCCDNAVTIFHPQLITRFALTWLPEPFMGL
ncbi:MAG TPA: hypothetical protein VHH73_09155 [Verrucomicrobiae bacterium]|nr:hypothetical protein [Verrucomicrobiae bacterium]